MAGVVSKTDTKPCPQFHEKHICNKDEGLGRDNSQSCAPSPCITHCKEQNCTADTENLCQWSSTLSSCSKEKICDKPKAECTGNCEWDDNANDGAGNKGTCVGVKCDHNNEQGCVLEDGCVWDNLKQECKKEPCPHTTSAVCDADNDCEWRNETCVTKKCNFDKKEPCEASNGGECEWKVVGLSNEC
eukprot:gene32522-9288_t